MTQNEGEPFTDYVARVRAKAFLCHFSVTCPCDPAVEVSYADEMVAQQLIAGLSNREHQTKVLSEAASLITLQQKVKRLQVLETTEESATLLQKAPGISEAAATSTYKSRKMRGDIRKSESSQERCKGCGRRSHPQGKTMERKNCPAWNKNCNRCQKKGHFAVVCQGSASSAQTIEEEVVGDETPLEEIEANASTSFAFSMEDFRSVNQRHGKT